MTRQFDQKITDDFFNTTFAESQRQSFENNLREDLHSRDLILIKRILPAFPVPPKCILDYGCGQGKLLHHLLTNGFNAFGMDRNIGMLRYATEQNRPFEGRVTQGSLQELKSLPSESYDLIVVMGVFQYLSESDYGALFSEINRLLSASGSIVCSFQNALFDLFTFNKYTIDFLENELLELDTPDLAGNALAREDASRHLKGLMTNPDKPDFSPSRARDNIFVRLSNPLTIHEEFQTRGFSVAGRYFYDYFGLPPLIASQNSAISKKIKDRYEIVNAESWKGIFMANAFLIHAVKK